MPQRTRGGWGWLRVLLIGLLLFIVTTVVMFVTENLNLYPTVILIGNFLVPVTFVAFLYDHQDISSLTPYSVATSFCVGGVLGVLGASLLELLLLPASADPSHGISLGNGLLVGFIEEGCKIVAVMIVARRMRHSSEMDGLLLGGAVGMGFAALESTGYAFTSLLLSGGHLSASIVETVIRGLFAPFGHGVWTALLGAVLFRASASAAFSDYGACSGGLPFCLHLARLLGWSAADDLSDCPSGRSYFGGVACAWSDRYCHASDYV